MNACAYCGQPVPEDEMVLVRENYFHWECFFVFGEELRKAREQNDEQRS